MATDNNSYFSNSYPGSVEAFGGNIFRLDAAPKYALGFRISRQDGNIYRYSQFGAATNRGLLVSQDVSETSIPDTDNGIVASASAVTTTDGTIGSRFIQITMDGIIANQFQGGYFITTDDAGEGYTYRIKGNTASGNPASLSYRMELYEPLQVAVTTATDYTIVGCMYNDLEAATTTDAAVVGVSCATTTAAKPFSFIQTRGVCGVLTDASTITNLTIGDMVQLSSLTAGAIGVYAGGSIGTAAVSGLEVLIVGYCIDPGDATGQSAIFLQLE